MNIRVDSHQIGTFLHVFNRGNRKMPIVLNLADKWRFLKILRFFNDVFSSQNVLRNIKHFTNTSSTMSVSDTDINVRTGMRIKKMEPLVKILSYCLRFNHFHLLLKEITENGIPKFMRKLGIGYTNYFNLTHNEVGRIFQSGYRGVRVDKGMDLDYVDMYVQIINPIEEYPGGIEKALKEFDKAFEFVMDNPFCSLGATFGKRNLKIINRDILTKWNLKDYKVAAYKALIAHTERGPRKKIILDF